MRHVLSAMVLIAVLALGGCHEDGGGSAKFPRTVKPVQPLKMSKTNGPALLKPLKVKTFRAPSSPQPAKSSSAGVKPLDVKKVNPPAKAARNAPAQPSHNQKTSNESWVEAAFGKRANP